MGLRRLKADEKEFIKCFLLQHSSKVAVLNTHIMKLHKGALEEVATKWDVSKRTIYTIWEEMRACDKAGILMNLKPKYGGNKKPRLALDIEAIGKMKLKKRKTIRALAANLDIGTTTTWRFKRDKELRASTSEISPSLTEVHMIKRLKWCLQSITVVAGDIIKFKDMDFIVQIDEKWFYMDMLNERFILLPNEVTPHRTCINKGFIPKLMFMCAVSRPIFGQDGELIWDGRLGIWPFVEEVAAQRNSVNRPRGTVESKTLPSINRQVMKEMLLENVIPAVKRYWPHGMSKNIKIQQDNAPCHIPHDDVEIMEACHSDGFNISFANQPPRSPDMKINDLGFSCSIQILQQEMQTESIEELIQAVQMAFEVLKPETLDDVFLSSQQCMVEIMKVKWHNKYQPHMGKQRLRALGILPRYLEVEKDLVKDCIEYLFSKGEQIDNTILLETLGFGN